MRSGDDAGYQRALSGLDDPDIFGTDAWLAMHNCRVEHVVRLFHLDHVGGLAHANRLNRTAVAATRIQLGLERRPLGRQFRLACGVSRVQRPRLQIGHVTIVAGAGENGYYEAEHVMTIARLVAADRESFATHIDGNLL